MTTWIDRRPMIGYYCGGSNWLNNPQGLDPRLLTDAASVLDPLFTRALGVTNRVFIHMPQGWLENNTYGVSCSRVLVPHLESYFRERSPIWKAAGFHLSLYTGSRMPRVGGTGGIDLDSFSQVTGPEVGSIPLPIEHAEWFIQNCVDLFTELGWHQLWLDAFESESNVNTLFAIENLLAGNSGLVGGPIGTEPLPLTYFSADPADNAIDESRIGLRPYMILERNFMRTRDPNDEWVFDTATTEVHCVVDNQFADWGEVDGIARLNDIVARGMIVSLAGDVPAWVEDWWRNQYGTNTEWLWNKIYATQRKGPFMGNTYQVFTHDFSLVASGTLSIFIRNSERAFNLFKYKVTGDDTKFDDKKIKLEIFRGSTQDGTTISNAFAIIQNGTTSGWSATSNTAVGEGTVRVDAEYLNGASRGGENPGLTFDTSSGVSSNVLEFRFTAPSGLDSTTNVSLVASFES